MTASAGVCDRGRGFWPDVDMIGIEGNLRTILM
jgi:hypothetical protein